MTSHPRKRTRLEALLAPPIDHPEDVGRLRSEIPELRYSGITDADVQRIWRAYSDDEWRAGWYSLPDDLSNFRRWLKEKVPA